MCRNHSKATQIQKTVKLFNVDLAGCLAGYFHSLDVLNLIINGALKLEKKWRAHRDLNPGSAPIGS